MGDDETAELVVLVAEENENDLTRRVNEMLERGWDLYGSPTMAGFLDTSGDWPRTRTVFAQALVKRF